MSDELNIENLNEENTPTIEETKEEITEEVKEVVEEKVEEEKPQETPSMNNPSPVTPNQNFTANPVNNQYPNNFQYQNNGYNPQYQNNQYGYVQNQGYNNGYYQNRPVVNQPVQNQMPRYNAPNQYRAPQNQVPRYNAPNQYRAPQNQMPNYNRPMQNGAPRYTAPQNQIPMNNVPNQNPYYNQYNQANQNIPNNPYNRAPKQKLKYNQMTGQYEPYEKEPLKTSTVIFISIIAVLLVVFAVGFVTFFNIVSKGNANDNAKSPTSSTSDNFQYFFGDNLPSNYEYETVEYEIELQEDDGTAVITDSDKVENDIEPDSSFSDIKTNDVEKKESKDSTAEEAYETVSPAVVGVLCYKDKITDKKSDIVGEGTGTILSSDGYILTNSHVIGNSKQYIINITFGDQSTKQAKIVGFDTRTDIAILKVDATDLPFVSFANSDQVKVGEDIIAIGNPGGTTFQNSLTKGIVSFVGRELSTNDMLKYIQIDASINPGNSGGPLCNTYGQVIGINTAKIASTEYEGMGFAIPSNTAVDIANQLIKYGYVQNRVKLGITGTEISESEVAYYGYPNGILISEIAEGGPCDNVGIKENDILISVDGENISTFQNVFAILETHKPGDKIKIVVAREKNSK